jgi:hypothetical protein
MRVFFLFRQTATMLLVTSCILVASAGCVSRPVSRPIPLETVGAAALPRPASLPTSVAAVPEKPVSTRQPNEGGLIPILEYHRITTKPTRYDRTAADFRRDLERLYREGYRPVALQDLLSGKIDLPRGASPVVLTFDDADASQFRYRSDGTIDPDCAVGILEAFARKHPDWTTRATFYVLPDSAFGPAKERAEKFRYLREKMGCEIGNHTVTHRSLRSLPDQAVQREIGEAVQKIQTILPGTPVQSIALPMGISPKNRTLLATGSFDGHIYTNKAVLLVGANPAPSPASTEFDPLRLPRIQAVEGEAGITYWLDRLRKPGAVFVSDGDPEKVTMPSPARH